MKIDPIKISILGPVIVGAMSILHGLMHFDRPDSGRFLQTAVIMSVFTIVILNQVVLSNKLNKFLKKDQQK